MLYMQITRQGEINQNMANFKSNVCTRKNKEPPFISSRLCCLFKIYKIRKTSLPSKSYML